MLFDNVTEGKHMSQSDENVGIMAEVASLYFEERMSQQEIADRLYFSRSKVSRLLTRAIEDRVVEIIINHPMERIYSLENELKKIYHLKEAIVIKDYGTSYPALLRRVAKTAAAHLDSILTKHTTIGITWGETIYNVVEAVKPSEKKRIDVIQLMGSAEHQDQPAYDSPELVRKLAEKYGGNSAQIYCPLVVENELVRNSLIKEPIIKRVLNEAREAKVVLASVGDLYNNKTKAWESILTPPVKQKLKQNGAVGVLLAHFIKMDGNLADRKLDKQVIGISLEDLRSIENVIIVAAGIKKANNIFGALNGGYVNTLIVDELLAQEVLNQYRKYTLKTPVEP